MKKSSLLNFRSFKKLPWVSIGIVFLALAGVSIFFKLNNTNSLDSSQLTASIVYSPNSTVISGFTNTKSNQKPNEKWIDNNGTSGWVVLAGHAGCKWNGCNKKNGGGNFKYSSTFNLKEKAKVVIKGRYSVDDKLVSVIVNGDYNANLSSPGKQWTKWTPFTITIPADKTEVGKNTIVYTVKDTGCCITGIRVEYTSAEVNYSACSKKVDTPSIQYLNGSGVTPAPIPELNDIFGNLECQNPSIHNLGIGPAVCVISPNSPGVQNPDDVGAYYIKDPPATNKCLPKKCVVTSSESKPFGICEFENDNNHRNATQPDPFENLFVYQLSIPIGTDCGDINSCKSMSVTYKSAVNECSLCKLSNGKFDLEPKSTKDVIVTAQCQVEGGDLNNTTETDIDISHCSSNAPKGSCEGECTVTIKDVNDNCKPRILSGGCAAARDVAGWPVK